MFYNIFKIRLQWEDNKWQVEATDDSVTIAYSKERISKYTITEWTKKKLEKYRNESK